MVPRFGGPGLIFFFMNKSESLEPYNLHTVYKYHIYFSYRYTDL
jgi:hypothetical protein